MKKRNYRENFFISEKFSVIYISKERTYFISLYWIFESNSYHKFYFLKLFSKKLKKFIFLVSNLMKTLIWFCSLDYEII